MSDIKEFKFIFHKHFVLIMLMFMMVSFPILSYASKQISEPGKDSFETIPFIELIQEHVGDNYSWPLLGIENSKLTLPLPVILYVNNQGLFVFLSSKIAHHQNYKGFFIASEGPHAGKILYQSSSSQILRPIDLSITKNVAATMVGAFILCLLIFRLKKHYKDSPMKVPKRLKGCLEVVIVLLETEVIRPILKEHAHRYSPYLLTLFFFILIFNLLSLVVIFPGGVNITGNASVCFVLALCTLFLTIISATKHYWKEIFLPEVPLWLNTPIPIFTVIEVFGIFTKPFALMIRLFANLFGGHIILIVLSSLIFLFIPFGVFIMGLSGIVMALFSIFMWMIEILVSFIQAYVFFMLTTLFVALTKV